MRSKSITRVVAATGKVNLPFPLLVQRAYAASRRSAPFVVLPFTIQEATMARLTNRPSIASSRYTSTTPDPRLDQENMDPNEQRRDKGKQRASTLPTPPSNDDQSTASKGQKRKRTIPVVTTPEDNEEEEEDEEFTRYFDPNQNPEERREVKRRFRELERDFIENREELKNDSGQRLTKTVEEANKIFSNVKQTGDACPDSRLLVNVGDLAYKKSAALVSDDNRIGIDLDEFLSKALSYIRSGADRAVASQRQAHDLDDYDEEQAEPLDWDYLGRYACYPYNARPPVPSFLLGPLSLEKKQRAPTQRRARQEKDNSREARPEALTSQDLTQSDQNSLTTQCTEIRQHLKSRVKRGLATVGKEGITSSETASTARGKALLEEVGLRHADGQTGVPLFRYVVNPQSFGQTIENLFYVSFLIKEGGAGLALDDEGLPVLRKSVHWTHCDFTNSPLDVANANSIEQQRAQNITKHQAVLALDWQTWQDLVKAYNITESMIPHREEAQPTQLGNRGWYS